MIFGSIELCSLLSSLNSHKIRQVIVFVKRRDVSMSWNSPLSKRILEKEGVDSMRNCLFSKRYVRAAGKRSAGTAQFSGPQ